MIDQDKILLMSYLDNQLSADEILEVEALISTDLDAQDYLNQLKMTNNEVDAFFSSEDMKLLDASVSEFVETLKPQATSSSFQLGEVISSFFFSRQLVTYSLTAMIFLTAGLFYNQSIPFDLESTVHQRIVWKTRSISNSETSIKIILEDTLNEMVENKSANGELMYGSESYKITLMSKTLNQVNLYCYDGEVILKDQVNKILFCKTNKESSLIFLD